MQQKERMINKLRFSNIFFIFLVLISMLYGCGLTGNLIDWKGDSAWDSDIEWHKRRLSELRQYIGRSKKDIISVFGSPLDIRYNINTGGVIYEEEWLYRYESGIPIITSSTHNDYFYFNSDILEVIQ